MTSHATRPPAPVRQALAALLFAAAAPALAQIDVSAGSSLALGSGTLEQGCTVLNVNGTVQVDGGQWRGITHLAIGTGGTLHAGSGTLALAGQFSGGTGFVPGTGTVRIADGCDLAAAGIQTATSFHTLDVNTAQGRTLTLPAAATQAIAHRLALAGGPGALLRLRSSAPGSAAYTALLPGASQSVAYVDVADNHATAQPIAPGPAANYHSVQGSNVQRWFGTSDGHAALVPTLGHLGLALMAALLCAFGWFAHRRV